jgi:hypothetical protein
MTSDEIKALVERLRGAHKLDIVDFDLYLNAADALALLSDQLTAKTELATLYAASLRQSEAEVEGLKTARSSEITEAEIDAACSAYLHKGGTLREVMRAVIAAARRAARSQIDKEKPHG